MCARASPVHHLRRHHEAFAFAAGNAAAAAAAVAEFKLGCGAEGGVPLGEPALPVCAA